LLVEHFWRLLAPMAFAAYVLEKEAGLRATVPGTVWPPVLGGIIISAACSKGWATRNRSIVHAVYRDQPDDRLAGRSTCAPAQLVGDEY
jgi:hypothetical protein